MTREEASRILTYLKDKACSKAERVAINMAVSALRPISREQVEKAWRGEWEWYDENVGNPLDGIEREWGWRCSKCKTVLPDDFDDPDNTPGMIFCPWCSDAKTDEAVEMVMKRMEEMKNG